MCFSQNRVGEFLFKQKTCKTYVGTTTFPYMVHISVARLLLKQDIYLVQNYDNLIAISKLHHSDTTVGSVQTSVLR